MNGSGLKQINMKSVTEFEKASCSIPKELLTSNAVSLPDEVQELFNSEKARKDTHVSLMQGDPKTATSAGQSSSKLDKAYESALNDAIVRDQQML